MTRSATDREMDVMTDEDEGAGVLLQGIDRCLNLPHHVLEWVVRLIHVGEIGWIEEKLDECQS